MASTYLTDIWIPQNVTMLTCIITVASGWALALRKEKKDAKEKAIETPINNQQTTTIAVNPTNSKSSWIINFSLMAVWIGLLTFLLQSSLPFNKNGVFAISISAIGAVNQFRDLCRLYFDRHFAMKRARLIDAQKSLSDSPQRNPFPTS